MTQRIFVPRDASAVSVGAQRVVRAIEHEAQSRGLTVEIVRNGSRGLYWLEPLIEIESSGQRIAYGPVRPEDVAGLFDAGWLQGDLTWYSGSLGKDVARPKWLLVTHMFNHQTHHRGQVHCMLTQSGIAPGVTDLAFMPD